MQGIGINVRITKAEFGDERPTNHFQLAEYAWTRANVIMKLAGKHTPMAVLVVDDGFLLVDLDPVYNIGEAGKEIAMMLLHQLARDEGAVGVVMVNEAWYASTPLDEKITTPVKERKDRIEALVVHAQMRTGSHMIIGDIIRNEDRSFREVRRIEDEPWIQTRSRFDGIITQGDA